MLDLTTTPKTHTAQGAARVSPSRSPEAHCGKRDCIARFE